MAKSFWSRRSTAQQTGDYSAPKKGLSTPVSIALIGLGIVLIGALLFGIFQGAKWSFNKLSDSDSVATTPATPDEKPNDTPATPDENQSQTPATPPVTVTSSTSTTTPQPPTTTATTARPSAERLPSTGPASNTAIFIAVLIVSFLVARKRALKQ